MINKCDHGNISTTLSSYHTEINILLERAKINPFQLELVCFIQDLGPQAGPEGLL